MATPDLIEPAPADAEPQPPLRARRVRARLTPGRLVARIIGALVVVAVAAFGIWMLTHPQRVSDQFAVWQYEPDAAVTRYAERSTMTDEGRFLFYASHPAIAAGDDFAVNCSSQLEDVGILGCYQHGSQRIYLFDVTDDRLDGIEDVVAAHEMLHAAWDRLSDGERDILAPLLEAEAATRSADPEFAKTLEYYAEAEPTERLNELHSIIGTEFAALGSASA